MSINLEIDRDVAVEIMDFNADQLKANIRGWYDRTREVAAKTDTLAQVKIKLKCVVDGKTIASFHKNFDSLDKAILPSIDTKINQFIISNDVNRFIDESASYLRKDIPFEIICKASAYGACGSHLDHKTWTMMRAPG